MEWNKPNQDEEQKAQEQEYRPANEPMQDNSQDEQPNSEEQQDTSESWTTTQEKTPERTSEPEPDNNQEGTAEEPARFTPENSSSTEQHTEEYSGFQKPRNEEPAQEMQKSERELAFEHPQTSTENSGTIIDGNLNPKFSSKRAANVLDEELEQLLHQHTATIKVVGCGGAGNNTVTRIKEVGVAGTETISVNTDAQDLLYSNCDKKLLVGRELTKGLGAGAIPKIGEEAARESEQDIKNSLVGADLIFITAGLGGGTGTGSAPVVAEVSKKLGALTVGIVTMPFVMEGTRRYENAAIGLEKLEKTVDTLIVIPNDKLLLLAPELPLHTAFKVADEILTNAVKGIAELVTKPGLINLDFADIRTVMGNGGVALIGVGESDTDNRAMEAVEKALSNPLLDVDISGANGALVNISGGSDFTLEEARNIVEAVSSKMDPDARVIWGAQVNEDMKKTVRALLIITGVKSSQILGDTPKKRETSSTSKKEIESELGIEFVD